MPHASGALRGLMRPSKTPGVPGFGPVSLVSRVLATREQHGDKLSGQGTACHHQEDPALTVVAGTTSTVHGASRSTRPAILPMKKRVTPRRSGSHTSGLRINIADVSWAV